MDEILTQAVEIYKVVSGDNIGKSLSLFGVIFILSGLYYGYQIINRDPSDVSSFSKIIAISVTIVGILFSISGPSYTLLMRLEYFRNILAKDMNVQQRMNNLRKNRTVHSVIRIVVYNPKTDQNLQTSSIQYLGKKEQKFTFVADYDELKGLTFKEASQRIGVKLHADDKITAIIFPAPDPIYPANARGLLKVINLLENDTAGEPKLDVEHRLGKSALDNLEIRGQSSYAFDMYAKNFSEYCQAASQFRCAKGKNSYAVAPLIGSISDDWEYLGYARTDDPQGVCMPMTVQKECDVENWDQAKDLSRDKFGVRVFLVENRMIENISGRIMIDVVWPELQTIPFYIDSSHSLR